MGYKGYSMRREEALRKCNKCGIEANNEGELPLFVTHSTSLYGKKNLCKDCNAKAPKTTRTLEKNRIRTNRLRKENKAKGLEYVKEYYGFPFECMKCGYTNELFAPFDLHHRDPSEKEGTPSQLFKQSFDRFKKEVSKCDLVCANCHRIEHFKEKENES
jgi:hypothetical protein